MQGFWSVGLGFYSFILFERGLLYLLWRWCVCSWSPFLVGSSTFKMAKKLPVLLIQLTTESVHSLLQRVGLLLLFKVSLLPQVSHCEILIGKKKTCLSNCLGILIAKTLFLLKSKRIVACLQKEKQVRKLFQNYINLHLVNLSIFVAFHVNCGISLKARWYDVLKLKLCKVCFCFIYFFSTRVETNSSSNTLFWIANIIVQN